MTFPKEILFNALLYFYLNILLLFFKYATNCFGILITEMYCITEWRNVDVPQAYQREM